MELLDLAWRPNRSCNCICIMLKIGFLLSSWGQCKNFKRIILRDGQFGRKVILWDWRIPEKKTEWPPFFYFGLFLWSSLCKIMVWSLINYLSRALSLYFYLTLFLTSSISSFFFLSLSLDYSRLFFLKHPLVKPKLLSLSFSIKSDNIFYLDCTTFQKAIGFFVKWGFELTTSI